MPTTPVSVDGVPIVERNRRAVEDDWTEVLTSEGGRVAMTAVQSSF